MICQVTVRLQSELHAWRSWVRWTLASMPWCPCCNAVFLVILCELVILGAWIGGY